VTENDLASLLVEHRDVMESLVSREASGLLKFENPEDIVQGMILKALGSEATFKFQGIPAFRSWLTTIARRHIADRHGHWSALRRGSGRIIRYSASGTDGFPFDLTPVGTQTGPSTFASRREQCVLAIRALDVLTPRDRDLVRWICDGMPLSEQAERLELTGESTRKAGQRALERFRKAFRLVARTAQ